MRLLIVIIFFTLAVGCSRGVSDSTKEYVKTIKSRKSNELLDLPTVDDWDSISYDANKYRSPFGFVGFGAFSEFDDTSSTDVEIVEQELQPIIQQDSTVVVSKERPDAGRIREHLEKFDLSSLKFVGVLRKDDLAYGLVLDREGLLHRVGVGDYMGRNSGRVQKVSDEKITLYELVFSESNGDWQERKFEIELSY